MPTKKGKKKAQAGNTRGFATTSIPAKVRDAPSLAEKITENGNEIDTVVATSESDIKLRHEEDLEAKALAEAAEIVESGTKAFTRFNAEVDVEKRSRKTSIQLSLPEASVERILNLARHDNQPLVSHSVIESLKCLYTGELLLRKLGLPEETIEKTLAEVADVSIPDASLYHVRNNNHLSASY